MPSTKARTSSLRSSTEPAASDLVGEFPTKLGQEVRVLRERDDGDAYRACVRCGGELDLDEGEWVPAFPQRKTHGYCISQLLSAKVEAAEILHEYRTTRFAERFYNMKIGVAWADVQNRLTTAEVLACCGEHGMLDALKGQGHTTMGVDTGKRYNQMLCLSF